MNDEHSDDILTKRARDLEGIISEILTRQESGQGEQFLQGMLDAIQDGIGVRTRDLTLTRVNRWLEKRYASQMPLIGKKCYAAFHNRQDPCPGCPSISAMETGKPQRQIMPYSSSEVLSGWLDLSAFPLINGNGEVIGVIEHIRDITKSKQAEEKLRKSENQHRRVLEASPDPIVVYDIEGKVVYLNPSFTRVFGWTQEELQGRKVDYVPEENWTETTEMIERLRGGESFSGIESRRYTKKGHTIDVSISVATYLDQDGKLEGSVHTLRDISNRKKMEVQLQQAQKMEAIGTLAGGIAHDFNNILSAILGYTELAQLGIPEKSQQRANLDQVLKAAARARDLVQQILAFSRQGEHDAQPIQLEPVIKEALKMLRASIPSTIDIRRNIEGETGPVMADPTQVHQVLINLCTNAAHAMMKEGGVITVTLRNIDFKETGTAKYRGLKSGPYVQLSVSDAGHGMSKKIQDKIFDPYFTTKEKGVGTGLGLAVVHGIVTRYGGMIFVDSKYGKGTTFDAFFPRTSIDQKKSSLSVQSLPRGSEHILFVDDENMLINIGKQMLEHLGYKVTAVTDPCHALETFRENPGAIDLVITDQTMPYITGDKLAKEILSIRSNLPIIICTGYSNLVSANKAKLLGIKKFITKPLAMQELAVAIREVLDGHSRDH